MFSSLNHTALSFVLTTMVAGPLIGQSDLPKLIQLIDQKNYSALAEIEQLREKNSQNRQQAGLYDFGYGLAAVKFSRFQVAIDVLQPFVDQRPQNFQARLLLLRAYIDLVQFDQVVLQVEKLLDNLPAQDDAAEKIVKHVGTIVGFVNFARTDCSDAVKHRLEKIAETKIPESLTNAYRESIELVESRVATINEEIQQAAEKAGLETDKKVVDNLTDAEKLRAEAETKAKELKSREDERAETFEKLKLALRNVEHEYGKLTTQHVSLTNQVDRLKQQRRSLEKEEESKDINGKTKTETVITDERKHEELGERIRELSHHLRSVEERGRVLMNNFQQMRAQAAGLLNQQQLDSLFTQSNMQQLSKSANLKEKKAERESERKGKKVPAERGLTAKLKSFSTYEPLDVASNKEYLQEIAKRWLKK